MIVTDDDANRALKFLESTELDHAQAKANVREIEKSEKALIAALKLKSPAKSGNAKEDDAYASEDYRTWLRGYAAAVENLTVLENKRGRAETVIEMWRTCSASARKI